jgi:crotonobetainyl-CoA:carnitine CoA-transferase CaiB-like acyl-CoA transferase
MSTVPLPLSSILVADLSRVLAGPIVGMTLGDLGADVIKVEPPNGDDTRAWAPPIDSEGRATYHHAANRNKRSVALDLKRAKDLERLRRLCSRADVVVSNFRPGTLDRYEIDYDRTAALNPGVVYCEISGFGEGTGASLAGYDPLVQAVGGMMSITGPPGLPSKTGVALVDMITGLYATTAVLAALHEREASGRGQRVTINLLHTTLAALCNQATGWLGTGATPESTGNNHPSIEPFGTYRAADGDLMLCVGNDLQFRKLVFELGSPELASDKDFASNSARLAARHRLRKRLESALASATCDEWVARLSSVGVPAGTINTVPEAFSYAERLGMAVVDEIHGVRTVSFPAELSRTPAVTRYRPPDFDEHGDAIRAWLDQ